MKKNPELNFFISSTKNPVKKNDNIWNSELPQKRNNKTHHDNCIKYGEFFSLIEFFFKEASYKNIIIAVSEFSKNNIREEDIEKIDIFLEKHGEFYHPVRINVSACGESHQFVLNIAVSEKGKFCMEKEVNTLKKLKTNFSSNYITDVYYYSENVFLNENQTASIFIGEWFNRYHEFHISYDFQKQKKIIVWDPSEQYYLTKEETKDVYKQATKILTCYYDVNNFKQIFPWHHAAGDFILKRNHNKIDVKLITVRQYYTLFDISPDEIDNDVILEGLFIFFINISLRMRIDRIDGVGEIVWSDDISVQGIVEGFLEGLSLKKPLDNNEIPLKEIFIKVLKKMNEKDFMAYFIDMVNSYHPKSPDLPVIIENLEKHIKNIYKTITKY